MKRYKMIGGLDHGNYVCIPLEVESGDWVRYDEAEAEIARLMDVYMTVRAQLAKQEQAHEAFLSQVEAELKA